MSDVEAIAVPLFPPADGLDELWSWLSDDKRERAERFRFERHRVRFVVCRARLRQALGRRLGLTPVAVRFVYGPQGKPALREGHLHFNLAHSEDLALIGIADEALGVDLEWVKPVPELDAIARHHFSPAERAALDALNPAERTLGFFHAWTRKEAMLKATGHGLSLALDHYTVSLAPGESPRVLEVKDAPGEAANWRLVHVEPEAGFVGAIAWQGGARTLREQSWQADGV